MNSSRVNGDDIPQKKGTGCAVFPTCNIWDIQSKISCELKFISSGHFPAGLILSGWVNQELDDQPKTCRFDSGKNLQLSREILQSLHLPEVQDQDEDTQKAWRNVIRNVIRNVKWGSEFMVMTSSNFPAFFPQETGDDDETIWHIWGPLGPIGDGSKPMMTSPRFWVYDHP